VQRKRPSSPFPSQTAKASFLAPDTLHDKWKCSSAVGNRSEDAGVTLVFVAAVYDRRPLIQ
jgi:hypothetical protein